MMEIDRAKVKLAVRRTGKGPSLAQLLKWRDDILATVSTFPAFSSLDLDEQSGKIVIGLEKLDEADSLRGILSGAKIPADVLLIEQSSMALTYPIPGSVFSRSRPLAGGVIIGSSECTLGIAALAESGAYSFLMTAGHCSPTFGVPDAYWMRQPLSGMQLMGYEFYDYSWTCAGGRCDNADIGLYTNDFVDYNAGIGEIPLELGLVWRMTARVAGPNALGALNIDQQFPRLSVTGIQSYGIMSQVVDKVGRSSGWTFGNTYKTCALVQFNANYKLNCQDYASYTSDYGDSGGPVFVHYPNIAPSPGGNGITFLGINSAKHLENNTVKGGSFTNTNQIRSEIGLFRFW